MINSPELQNKIDIIYNAYGHDTQIIKLLEELAEVIREIARDDPERMVQEMADVYVVMTGILQNTPWMKEIFDEEIEFKVNRQLDRIKNA